ncbi:MAG: hypothetical protein JKY02_07520 [Flavobacteriaceae bacterium]|nr:hypothetical protein [Flavobacteriaceae bacterium]
MKSIYKLTILLLLIPTILLGNNDNDKKRHEKSKTIKKSFTVNSKAALSISNKYGDINVTTRSKNRIEIDIRITVKGNDLDEVEEQLRKINVDFNSSASFVEANTRFGKNKSSWSFWKKSRKISYQINYTVKMPVTNNIRLNNNYGSINLDELEGEASISCDYGKITIGDLKGDNNDINLDYCSASTINSVRGAKVNIDYSKLTIGNSENVKLNTDYSTVKLNSVTNLTFNSDYGSISVGNVVNASGNGDYTGFKFGTVKKNLKISSDYGSIRIDNLANGFESVSIDSEYAGIRIGTSTSNNFKFIIDLQYASFKRNDSNVEIFKSTVKSTKKYYEGVYGKGNSNSKITIKSEYGSVTLNEN